MLKPGDQIVYIPAHAKKDPDHPDREYGFVESVRGTTAYCRYWRKGQPGVLRTVANSEATNIMDLQKAKSYSQEWIRSYLSTARGC